MELLSPWSATAFCAAGLGLGWLWTRWRRFDRSRAATVYLKGFQYLLSGDPDGAIELLTRVASSGTLEAYFTLGSLYRRKGELERALQLHRNVLMSPGLEPRIRKQAFLELGRDYRQGALWAQAAESLEAACREPGDGSPDLVSREELRDVYIAASRWAEAARCQELLAAGRKEEGGSADRRAEAGGRSIRSEEGGSADRRAEAGGPKHSKERAAGSDALAAHLWAEASQARLAERDLDGAAEAAASALRVARTSAHARFAGSAVSAARGDLGAARREILAAAEAEPWASGLLFPWLAQAHPAECRPALLEELEAWLAAGADRPANVHARLLQAQLFKAAGRQAEAAAALRLLLEGSPAFLAARRELGEILLLDSPEARVAAFDGELREQYQVLLSTLSADTALGRCGRCAQPARELRWRCPACGAWDWFELRAEGASSFDGRAASA